MMTKESLLNSRPETTLIIDNNLETRHIPRFKCSWTFGDDSYTGVGFGTNKKAAEHHASQMMLAWKFPPDWSYG